MTRRQPYQPSATPPKRFARGFTQTGGILQTHIRKAGEKRGFAETRLLTHWAEIAGAATAAICRPVKIGYARQGFGATLTLLTNGANAPMLQADLPKLKERVNACYGYAAISHIRLTQTAEAGFAEAQAAFAPKAQKPAPDPEKAARINGETAGVGDEGLRSALAALGYNILTKPQNK
ncbi:MAG: DUF721 domain-containing protein [Rhodobacteraceae bacterium]|nr:DUF721 domain-containing protein [Paracoccaceae bacterium]